MLLGGIASVALGIRGVLDWLQGDSPILLIPALAAGLAVYLRLRHFSGRS